MDKKQASAKDRLILSLDVDTVQDAQKLVEELKDYVAYFKVGMYLFSYAGPRVIDIIHQAGGKVYFDGKFHDIPNTVAKAAEALVERGVTFFSVHTSGGSNMLKTCVDAANKKAEDCNLPAPTILGVTILTSVGQRTINEEIGITRHMCDYTLRLTELAKNSGLSGVVISGCEAKEVRKKVNNDFIILTPAIRPTWAVINDQLRVLTPRQAIEGGSDYLLVGRPITMAKNRITAARLILDEIEQAMERNL
jgi:orotidine-5'-phosphate decarboxylase